LQQFLVVPVNHGQKKKIVLPQVLLDSADNQ